MAITVQGRKGHPGFKQMTRTAEWVVERAEAEVAGRIAYTAEIKENGDVALLHEETNELFFLPAIKWAHPDNSDESVRKKIKRDIQYWLDGIGKRLKAMRETTANLAPDLSAPLPPPAPRKKGRPRDSKRRSETFTGTIPAVAKNDDETVTL